MVELLYAMSNIYLFILLSSVAIIFSVVSLYIVRNHIPLKFRYHENTVIGYISTNIGIIYAILVGFTALYELGNYTKADQGEQQEAANMISIYRAASLLPEPLSSHIHNQIKNYANVVINTEWPDMSRGKAVGPEAVDIIQSIFQEIHKYKADSVKLNEVQMNTLRSIATELNILYDDHEVRISMNDSALNSNVWFVLILASFLMIFINFFYGMEFHLHIVCIVCIALLVSAVLYLIMVMDRPFRGDFSVKPNTFKAALTFIETNQKV